MGKSAKIAKLRQDKFYKLAKEAGYRSRAAFKLIQLNRKFGFLNNARVVVDLCAAPGGWLQVCANVLPVSSVLIGVDLVPIKPIHNVITFTSDITTTECVTKIEKELQGWKADIVLHDGAPNLGQSWSSDSFGQARLTLSAIKLAVKILTEGGSFVTKIFRSKDYSAILKLLSQIFKHVHPTKPIASRRESAELFLVCQNFLGKSALNSINFDSDQVFHFEAVKTPITLKKLVSSKNINKNGYSDDACPFVYKNILFSDFIESDLPLEILATANSITNDVIIENNKNCSNFKYNLNIKTSSEIFEYFKDVRVLGIKEIRALLNFRQKCRKMLNIGQESLLPNQDEKLAINDDNDRENAEISAAIDSERREDKKLIKQRRKMERVQKIKLKKAAKQCAMAIDENEDSNLFSLKSLSNISELKNLLKSNAVLDEKPMENDRNGVGIHHEDYIDQVGQKSKKKFSKNPLVVDGVRSDSEESDEEIEADIEFLKSGGKKASKKSSNMEKKNSENAIGEDLECRNEDIERKERKSLKAEELALAAHIKASNRNRKQVIQDSWNRYIRPPGEDLPTWFKDYEKVHVVRTLPITKEEVEFYKKQQRELDAKPIKKVLEARARLKQKKIRIIEQTNARASKLLGDDGATDVEKMEQLKSIYKKANKQMKMRPKKKLIVAKKGLAAGKKYQKPKGIKGPVKIVDARMKKDKRNEQFTGKSKHRSKN